MAITKRDLIEWLEVLEDEDQLWIDDGELTLKLVDSPEIYIEIGGLPRQGK